MRLITGSNNHNLIFFSESYFCCHFVFFFSFCGTKETTRKGSCQEKIQRPSRCHVRNGRTTRPRSPHIGRTSRKMQTEGSKYFYSLEALSQESISRQKAVTAEKNSSVVICSRNQVDWPTSLQPSIELRIELKSWYRFLFKLRVFTQRKI